MSMVTDILQEPTIQQLLSGIFRYMRSCSCDTPNVLDRRDTRFKSIQGDCEVVVGELRKEGIGTSSLKTFFININTYLCIIIISLLW